MVRGEKRRSGVWEEREKAGGSWRSRADNRQGEGLTGEQGAEEEEGRKASKVGLSAGLNGRAQKRPP